MNKQTCEFVLQEVGESPYFEDIGTFATFKGALSALKSVIKENKILGLKSELRIVKRTIITNEDWKS